MRNARARDGRHSYCKPCLSEYQAARPNRAETHRRSKLKARYGVTEDEIAQMRLEQADSCAICGKPAPTDVDHDHRTGKVRGLLCRSCNRALGYFGDSADRLAKARDYLLRHDDSSRTLEESNVS